MAEIAAASSLVALLDFSGKILAAGYGFLAKVARAPAEIRTLLREVANINALLDQLQGLVNDPADSNAKNALQSLTLLGTFKTCGELLKTAEKCLESCQQSDGHQLKNLGRALKWPLTEREMKDTMQHLRILQDQLTAAVAVDSMVTLKRIDCSTKTLNMVTNATKDNVNTLLNHERTRDLMHWVSFESIDADESYQSALRIRQNETGKWFLMSPQIQAFLASKGGLFWVYGSPGSGKTILTSTVIEYLRSRFTAPEFGLTYFYCEDRDPKKQLLKNFLSILITQLIRIQPCCIEEVEASRARNNHDLTEADYVKLFKAITSYFEQVVIVVDALDESVEIKKFARTFAQLLAPSDNATRVLIFTTSREDVNIERLIAPLATYHLSLVGRMTQDIETYIAAEVKERIQSRTLKLRDAGLIGNIVRSLVDQAYGLFLQAKLQLEYVSNLRSDGAIKNALFNLPSGLDDTYERVLSEILLKTPHEAEHVKIVLRWLVGSYDLLTLDQLAEVVSLQTQDTQLDIDMIVTDPEDIVASCKSLVVVDRSFDPPVAVLAHSSVKEYLRSDRIAASSVSFFYVKDSDVRRDLAKTCMQFLSFDNFKDTAPIAALATLKETSTLSNTYHLLRYAAEYWHKHLRACNMSAEEFSREIQPKLRWFLQPDENGHQYSSWLSVWHFTCMACVSYRGCYDGCSYQPPIYHAISFGLDHVFNILLPHLHDIDVQFHGGWTPLTAALDARHSGIATKLLRAGANPNTPASEKIKLLTPLHVAAENAMGDIVEELLSAGANPHARTTTRTTPLYRAARSGSMRVLQMLHDVGCDVNARTWDNWTAICESILNNDVDMVRQLLSWGADCNITSRQGMTPYSLALSLGREKIVEMLKDKTSSEHRQARTISVDAVEGNHMDSDPKGEFGWYFSSKLI